METSITNDFTFWFIITFVAGGFCVILGFTFLSEYKKGQGKLFLVSSIIALILSVGIITGGVIMCDIALSNTEVLKRTFQSNDTVKSLIEECKERNAPGANEETENFTITLKSPYVVIGCYNTSPPTLIQYSEGLRINEKTFDDAKTVVLAYPYVIGEQQYQKYVNGSKSGSYIARRYAVSIYIYDVENRELKFLKKLSGREFPESAESYHGEVSLDSIKKAVDSIK